LVSDIILTGIPNETDIRWVQFITLAVSMEVSSLQNSSRGWA
jgi:hypothetical protein